MRATFVRWNPELNPGSGADLRDAATYTEFDTRDNPDYSRKYLMDWSVRMPGQTHDGDDVFMFTWANSGMAGLLGYGTIAGPQFQNPNWKDRDLGPMSYVPILWKFMLRPERAITVADVLGALPDGEWPNLNSGELLPPEIAEALMHLLLTKQEEERSAARRLNAAARRLNRKLVQVFPELLPQYEEAIELGGEETGYHVIYGDVLVPRIEMLARAGDWGALKPYLKFLEEMLVSADEYTINVCDVTVLESLFYSDLDREKIYSLLGVKSKESWDDYQEFEAKHAKLKSVETEGTTSPLGISTKRFSTKFGEFRILTGAGEVPFVVYDRRSAYLERMKENEGRLDARYLIVPVAVDVNDSLELELINQTVKFTDYDVLSGEWQCGWEYQIKDSGVHLNITLYWLDEELLGQTLRQPITVPNFPILKYQAGKLGNRHDARFLIAWGIPTDVEDIII